MEKADTPLSADGLKPQHFYVKYVKRSGSDWQFWLTRGQRLPLRHPIRMSDVTP